MRVSVMGNDKLAVTLSEFQRAELGANASHSGSIIMIPTKCFQSPPGEALRGSVIAWPSEQPDLKELRAVGKAETKLIPACKAYRSIFLGLGPLEYGYPRIPAMQFCILPNGCWTKCLYIIPLDELAEIHKRTSALAAADMDRVILTPYNAAPILRAITTVGNGDKLTVSERTLFFEHANRHLSRFVEMIEAHAAPFRAAMDRKLKPKSIARFNLRLIRDISPALYDDLVRVGCVISGSYLLRALTEGQSDFKANDIDIYCTNTMFSECRALHRCFPEFIKLSGNHYEEPRSDIAEIIAIRSFAHVKSSSTDNPKSRKRIATRGLSNMQVKLQFIILRDDVDIKKWIANTFDIGFLTSMWCEGKFHTVDRKELEARTGMILPSYMDGLDTMPPRRIWMTMTRIVKYTHRGFRIANIREFVKRVLTWYSQMITKSISQSAQKLPSIE